MFIFRMVSHDFLVAVWVGLWGSLWPVVAASEQTNDSPNLVMITVDDMSRDSIGSYGCSIPDITPNIDRLAAEGVSFDRAYVNIAICQPCRAVWLTGRYPHRNGALGFDPISEGVPTLPETLKTAGYYTAVIGKVPHTLPSRQEAFDYRKPRNELGQGRSPQAYAQSVAEAINNATAQQKPFFVMANIHDPHRPFAGSQQEKWNPRPEVRRTITPEEAIVPEFLPDLKPVRRELSEYFTSVHRADESVGAILETIEQQGRRDSTWVLFVSDHGMALPFSKTNCYPASNRSPWILRSPDGKEAGKRDAVHFISGIDVTPTLLQIAGLPVMDGCDGKSILPLLSGESDPSRDRVFTMINRTSGRNEYPMRAVTTASHVYIWNAWSDGEKVFKNESQSGRSMRAMRRASKQDPELAARVELFLKRTPEELYRWDQNEACLNNLVQQSQEADNLGKLRLQLRHWMEQTDDPQLPAFETIEEQTPE